MCGSLAVRTFSLKETCKKATMFSFVASILLVFCPLTFLIPGCMNSNFAGVAELYHNGTSSGQVPATPTLNDLSLKSPCNTNCRCSLKRFSPVCGSDSVTYFDACHAGCSARLPNKTYTNCTCIPGSGGNPRPAGGLAKLGYCDRKCRNDILFAALLAICVTISFAMAVPGKTVVLRCVPDNKRAFADGIQYLIFKTLGLLPGPIIFGHLVDTSCRLWQDNCGNKGRCFDYDIKEMSRILCFYGIGVHCVSCLCYFLSWYFCKTKVEVAVAPVNQNDDNGFGDQLNEKPEDDSPLRRVETRL